MTKHSTGSGVMASFVSHWQAPITIHEIVKKMHKGNGLKIAKQAK